jgi:DNA-binding transcriptional ArsR family regulator
MKIKGLIPNYSEAIMQPNSRKVLQALAQAGGISSFSDIRNASGIKDPTLVHHLDRLQTLNIIEKEVKGTYRLRYRTPLCYIFQERPSVPMAYLGLLGRRDKRTEPETEVALKLLSKEGIKPQLVYVVTSMEALKEWEDLKLPYQWILCYEDEIIDIDAVKRKIKPQLESLLKDYIVFIDCTSATKPATIAYYELAQQYYAPLLYVYEEKKVLKWLISKETIKARLNI